MTLVPADRGALERARADAARAMLDRWQASGWADLFGEVAELFAAVNAEIAVNATWPHAKRAGRPTMEDGR